MPKFHEKEVKYILDKIQIKILKNADTVFNIWDRAYTFFKTNMLEHNFKETLAGMEGINKDGNEAIFLSKK